MKYPLKGLHWKEFIDIIININYDDPESVNFIINSLESFLVSNADIFWKDPSRF